MDARALLARVFEPFYQAAQQLARHTGGLGLGLAIVRKHRRAARRERQPPSDGPGRAAASRSTLPLAAAPARRCRPRRARCRRQRVLLVDDNEDAAATVGALLRQLGHEVQVAHTAGQALAAARTMRPDVAILDIGLPDMDGYGLAAILRRTGRPELRLVALTGYGQKSDVDRALGAGFDLHLSKPAGLDDLRRALQGTAPIHAA
jgi:CheY-like chemotaxis protein